MKTTHPKRAKARPPNILFVRDSMQRAYMPGIWKYVQDTEDWTIIASGISDENPEITAGAIRWANAAIIDIFTPAMARFAASLRVPVVNLVEGKLGSALPTVSVDNRAVGRLAFDHLRSLGFRNYAFLPWPTAPDSDARQIGFLEAAKSAGLADRTLVVESVLSSSDYARDIERQAHILKKLPPSTGMLCFADWVAVLVLQAARVAGIQVPDDLAIMGVDDDELVCESARPALTSMNIANDRVGYEAARIAIGLSRGEAAPSQPLLIPPVGVIERLSTQVLATEDEDVSAALRFIEKQSAAGLHVSAEQVASTVFVSRRGLDGKFTKALGHTVADEIDRRQIRRTLALLERTNLGLREIASRCGFKTLSHLSRVVSKHTGRPPMEHRKWIRP